jgi:hypothetical protein
VQNERAVLKAVEKGMPHASDCSFWVMEPCDCMFSDKQLARIDRYLEERHWEELRNARI